MAFKLPWSNFHELNLDWILDKIKELREDVDNLSGAATPYTSTPEMDGIGSPGSTVSYARGDHQHPIDTSRASASALSQEVEDRQDADTTLQNNIAATNAKIKFSSSAPFMDSSSASAGFSDYIARADHVHPTDTSRASATDLATLTARVDSISGAASPYDVVPLMDGAGRSGSIGAYSRGDHQHPSDTSKLDKSGGTIEGDLQINQRLKLPKRERFVHVSATGWLRVATVPKVDGTKCTFTIVRKSGVTPSETHAIDLTINQNDVMFTNEHSLSDVLYVDKIRYSNAGKVDIHIDRNYESDIGVYMDAYAASSAVLDSIEMVAITEVDNAPAGEMILVSADFEEDTEHYKAATILTSTLTHTANTTLASIPRPEGKNVLTGYMAIRGASDITKALLGIGNFITPLAANDYQAATFMVYTTNANMDIKVYLYDDADVMLSAAEIYYKWY